MRCKLTIVIFKSNYSNQIITKTKDYTLLQ